MQTASRYYVAAWVDDERPEAGARMVGQAHPTWSAAIRYAETVLPRGAMYVVTTASRAVYVGAVGESRRMVSL